MSEPSVQGWEEGQGHSQTQWGRSAQVHGVTLWLTGTMEFNVAETLSGFITQRAPNTGWHLVCFH